MEKETNEIYEKGFTLVELIVVIGIAILLTSILVTYTRSGEKQIVFFKEQSVLISAVLRAKAFAVETFQPKLRPGLINPGEKVCGWGVSFDKDNNQYTIFKDILQPNEKNCLKPGLDRKYDPPGEKFEEFSLPKSKTVVIKCLGLAQRSGAACPGGKDRIDVIFIPPDPITRFFPYNQSGKDKEAVIVLELDDGSRKSEIRISGAGQISF